MEKDANPIKEVFDELFTLLETLETQNSAVLKFLKDQGIATEQKLAAYLEQAGNASSVKWRAARVRMEYLLSPSPGDAKTKEKEKEKEKGQPKQAAIDQIDATKLEGSENGKKLPADQGSSDNKQTAKNSEAGREKSSDSKNAANQRDQQTTGSQNQKGN
jgi:hypothetical protein